MPAVMAVLLSPTYDDTMLMELQRADGPHLADRLLYCMAERLRFVMTIHHDQHLLSGEHGAYTYGEGGLRHKVHIAAKESAVGDDGVGRERLLARTRCER